MTLMRRNNRQGERGNVFLVILLGVALFAALAFTISRSMRSDTTSTMSSREADLAASSIMDYGQKLQRAVERIRRKGISENDISFENSTLAGYTNANCTNNKCKVFNASGGAISYKPPDASWMDTSIDYWIFAGEACVVGVPDPAGAVNCHQNTVDDEDLVAVLRGIKKDICIRINEKLGITNPAGDAPADNGVTVHATTSKFTGTFSERYNIGETGSNINTRYYGCSKSDFNNEYHYHHVLMAR